jgi:hypothetical protein
MSFSTKVLLATAAATANAFMLPTKTAKKQVAPHKATVSFHVSKAQKAGLFSNKAKVDPSEWDCKVKGLPAASFPPMCEKLCPNAGGDGHPTADECVEYVCPTLTPCVTASGQIGSFQQLMMCVQKLDEAHPNDEIDAEREEEISREVAGAQHHNHDDDKLDEQQYAEHVEGKSAEVFHTMCLAKCPDHDGEGHPGFHECDEHICPALTHCVVGEDDKAGSFEKLEQCIGRLGEDEHGDGIDSHTEAEVAEEVAGHDHFEHEYNMHVAGQEGHVFDAVCAMKCPDADGQGEPSADMCETHICPFLHACVVDDHDVSGDFARLMHCLGEMSERAPGRDQSMFLQQEPATTEEHEEEHHEDDHHEEEHHDEEHHDEDSEHYPEEHHDKHAEDEEHHHHDDHDCDHDMHEDHPPAVAEEHHEPEDHDAGHREHEHIDRGDEDFRHADVSAHVDADYETKVQEEMAQQHDEPSQNPEAMYNEHVAGEPADVFTSVCNLKCPEHAGEDHTPTPEMCHQFICPTLRECVVHKDKAGDWDRLMHCLEELEEAHEGDKFDEHDEKDAIEEIATFIQHVHEKGI